MQEEYHAETINGVFTWMVHYGWGTLHVNVWLPSLAELVGIRGTPAVDGCYLSAMQGLNISSNAYWIDSNGGSQFTYFRQYNTSGGGQKLWNVCNRQQTWLRTPVQANTTCTRAVVGNNTISGDNTLATASYAVCLFVGKGVLETGLSFFFSYFPDTLP